MKHGITALTLIPARAEPSDKAEMTTQLLFGERYNVLDEHRNWMLVENVHDKYQCWIDRKMHSPLSAEVFERMASLPEKRCGDAIGFLEHGRTRFAVPCSAIFCGYDAGSFTLETDDREAKRTYAFEGRIARHDPESRVRHALRLLHTPYLWGGKSAFGLDCSGFTQVVFHCAGISLPRDAWQQADTGLPVDFIDLALPGDLVFFDNEEGRIIHVGIALEQGRIIHASGSVRIDRIDHEGIYNESLGAYTHKTRLIKRHQL